MTATNPNVPQSEIPDHIIIGKVREALAQSPDVNIGNMVVDAANGVVRLVGIVNTLHEKQTARRIAVRIAGSGHVDDVLSVALDHQILDPEIFEAVEEALGDYPEYDPTAVGVRLVEDGVVYLSGKVFTLQDSRGAVDIASRVKGVTRIVNEIEIAAGRPVDDITLANNVVDSFQDDPRVDPFDIHVRVEDGVACIAGEVDDEEAKAAVTELAATVPGLRKVVNELQTRESG
ncbi:MAG: BON domain-containing protein [Armatimonadota bacterium]|nr:BON domain-containing protein [Armatimonadota bacterium]